VRPGEPGGSTLGDGTDRALSPVVGKTLELGVLVLLVALLTSTLYGGVVPEYRSAAAGELGDRTLARAAGDVERAVPPNATGGLPDGQAAVAVRASVPLPDSIRGRTYSLVAGSRSLRLVHPHPSVGGETQLALPDRVRTVDGAWESGAPAAVAVRANATGVHLRLVVGE